MRSRLPRPSMGRSSRLHEKPSQMKPGTLFVASVGTTPLTLADLKSLLTCGVTSLSIARSAPGASPLARGVRE